MIFIRSKKIVFPLILALILSTMVLIGLAFLLASYGQSFGENWQHLINYLLLPTIINTLSLLVLNIIGCFFLGVVLAWVICRYEFYGRKWLQWILLLPLAIPPYVTAFIMFDLFDSSGNLNEQINALNTSNLSLDLQNIGYTAFAMIMVFYPYVYWLARSSLLNMQSNLLDSAKNLGLSELQLFYRVVVPLTRPAIIAGLGLVVFETLADFGTVSIFNVDTLTTLIYKMWFSFFDLKSALQLSGLLLLIVVIFYLLNHFSKGRGLRHNIKQGKDLPRIHLVGWQQFLTSSLCWLVAFITFFIPVGVLLFMVNATFVNIAWDEFFQILWNTLLIGGGVSVLLVGISFLLVISLHQLNNDFSCSSHLKISRFIDKLMALLRLGYVFPGSVIAISLIGVLAYFDDLIATLGFGSILAGGSLLLLFWAYLVRFLAVALNLLEGSISRLNRNLPAIATNLGLNQWQIKRKVYFLNLKVPITSALVLVFIEVIKEMPATLMLRPAEWETLAVNIYSYTSEGEWISAALPALAMVILCMFFIIFVFRQH